MFCLANRLFRKFFNAQATVIKCVAVSNYIFANLGYILAETRDICSKQMFQSVYATVIFSQS